MNIIKEAVLTSKFLRIRKDIGHFFIEIVVPSGYTYFEWDEIVYKVDFVNNKPTFSPTGTFYKSL